MSTVGTQERTPYSVGPRSAQATVGGGTVVRLGQVLRRFNVIVHPGDRESGHATFVGLEHIEPGTGRRVGSATVNFATMTGRKPTFRRGQIIYGYLRPYLNKVWIAEFDGCSSVDQFAFEVDETRANPQFLAAFLRSETFLSRAAKVTTPGQLPRISIEEIESVELGLPALPEQERIAARLTKQLAAVDRARAAAQSRLAAARALPAAYLREALEGLDTGTVELRHISRAVTDGTHLPPPFISRGIPFLFVRNIVAGRIDFNVQKYVSEASYAQLTQKYHAERGDLLFSAVGSFGVAVVVDTDERFVFQRHIAHIKPDPEKVDSHFLAMFLNSARGRAQSEAVALGCAQRTVTLKELRRFIIPLPSLTEQRRIASDLSRRLSEAERLVGRTWEELAAIEALPAALLREAFGEGGRDE